MLRCLQGKAGGGALEFRYVIGSGRGFTVLGCFTLTGNTLVRRGAGTQYRLMGVRGRY